MCLKFNCTCNKQLEEDSKLRHNMALSGGTGAVFFLGNRAHYQVLEQPYDVENGNTSTETIYRNTSVEELWPSEKKLEEGKYATTDYLDGINWNLDSKDVNSSYERQIYSGDHCIKRRSKRHSTEALLGDDMKPSLLNKIIDNEPEKHKSSRRTTVMQFLSSLSRRKRRMPEQVQYLQQMDAGLVTCTYRESCRCLDCQGRYFDCAEDSEDYSSDDENINVLDLENPLEPNDEVFLDLGRSYMPDNIERNSMVNSEDQTRVAVSDTDNQLQLEVAASTSAMLNLLLYHPFSCSVQ